MNTAPQPITRVSSELPAPRLGSAFGLALALSLPRSFAWSFARSLARPLTRSLAPLLAPQFTLSLVLSFALVFTGCASAPPQASSGAFLGLSPATPIAQAASVLKKQGFISAGTQDKNGVERTLFIAKKGGATISKVDLIACSGSPLPAALLFSGPNRQRVAAQAKAALGMDQYAPVPQYPFSPIVTGNYTPRPSALYEKSVRVALFAVEEKGLFGVSLDAAPASPGGPLCPSPYDPPNRRGKAVRPAWNAEAVKAEMALFDDIQQKLDDAGVSDMPDPTAPLTARPKKEAAKPQAPADDKGPELVPIEIRETPDAATVDGA